VGLGIDPAFAAGLPTLKQAAGFIEDPQSSTDWKPNLQLLVGVKAVEGSKRTIYFVQLTTLPPRATNSGPWQPTLRTNDWSWSTSNKAQFVSTLYPVRVRVFDETARQLKEGQTPMAWGMLTNGLLDMCRAWVRSLSQPRMNAEKRESNRRESTQRAQRILPLRLDRGEGGRRPGEVSKSGRPTITPPACQS